MTSYIVDNLLPFEKGYFDEGEVFPLNKQILTQQIYNPYITRYLNANSQYNEASYNIKSYLELIKRFPFNHRVDGLYEYFLNYFNNYSKYSVFNIFKSVITKKYKRNKYVLNKYKIFYYFNGFERILDLSSYKAISASQLRITISELFPRVKGQYFNIDYNLYNDFTKIPPNILVKSLDKMSIRNWYRISPDVFTNSSLDLFERVGDDDEFKLNSMIILYEPKMEDYPFPIIYRCKDTKRLVKLLSDSESREYKDLFIKIKNARPSERVYVGEENPTPLSRFIYFRNLLNLEETKYYV